MNKIKQQLFEACGNYVQERINSISSAMKDLESDLENESKSSAGDKYETGREMINIEWNKLSNQLQQFKMLRETLEKAKKRQSSGQIQLGSLIRTNMANYIVAIPAGQIDINDEKYFAIGANSPIAQILQDKKAGEDFSFNGKTNQIVSVE
ncbi:transcription elongation factor [Autumnicola edwardsiae]|uniref:Transcription elongation factor n=1 Tax=Autumnicola edwardsiae TaxID=3075594 RepID=A0ABU3CQN2_9FLAO|nr:transcription elongation factor [Zunongwangia sp. F297]MDT0648662.1 transcription elongation factor [Zunongwangia sp. F297]